MAGRKRKIDKSVVGIGTVATIYTNDIMDVAMPAYAEPVTLPPRGTNGKPHDHRCRHCGKLLCRAWLQKGSGVEIRCGRCGRISTWIGGKIESDIIAEE